MGAWKSTARRPVRTPTAVPLGEIAAEVHIGHTGGRDQLGCNKTHRTVEHQPSMRSKLPAEKVPILRTFAPIAESVQRVARQIVGGLPPISVSTQLIWQSYDVLDMGVGRTDTLEVDWCLSVKVRAPCETLPHWHQSQPHSPGWLSTLV